MPFMSALCKSKVHFSEYFYHSVCLVRSEETAQIIANFLSRLKIFCKKD